MERTAHHRPASDRLPSPVSLAILRVNRVHVRSVAGHFNVPSRVSLYSVWFARKLLIILFSKRTERNSEFFTKTQTPSCTDVLITYEIYVK